MAFPAFFAHLIKVSHLIKVWLLLCWCGDIDQFLEKKIPVIQWFWNFPQAFQNFSVIMKLNYEKRGIFGERLSE